MLFQYLYNRIKCSYAGTNNDLSKLSLLYFFSLYVHTKEEKKEIRINYLTFHEI